MDIDAMRRIEESLWFDGADAYRRHLAEEALVVVPGATLDRAATIAAISEAPRWERLERVGEQLLCLTEDTMLLHYRAEARRADGSSYEALISSVYRGSGAEPRLAFHQQTPVP